MYRTAIVAAIALSGCALAPAETPVFDFACSRDIAGHTHDTVLVEDVADVRKLPSGRFMVAMHDGGFYGYEPHSGEVCAMLDAAARARAGRDRIT